LINVLARKCKQRKKGEKYTYKYLFTSRYVSYTSHPSYEWAW